MRCVGFDRRGHGRSDCPPRGYDYNTLADDLADVIAALDLSGLTLVGHSMGAAEIVRYLTRHRSSRITSIVLIAPVLPFIRKTEDNPAGVPEEALEALRAAWKADFPKWVVGNTPPFFAPSRSAELMRWGSNMMLKTPVPVAIECNRAIADTDFRAELRRIDVPTLLIHGDRDVSAPIGRTGRPTSEMIPVCTFKVYEGAPHGLMFTHAERLHWDLRAFIGV
jgi:non-heme chloroperoxidase